MHVHANQTNPNIQLNTFYAAEKAEAKRETERTRKKLMEFASVLLGEAGEAFAVQLGARDVRGTGKAESAWRKSEPGKTKRRGKS
jgi:hypothetical protein